MLDHALKYLYQEKKKKRNTLKFRHAN
jgi:hypothetical protein